MTNADKPDFMSEMRDAVTPRAAVLVLGVLLIQFGFIASYLGAFHDPRPREIPIAVVAPAGAPVGTAVQTAARLNALPEHPVKATAAASEASARAQIKDRSVYGAVLLGAGAAGASVSQALEIVVTAVGRTQSRTVTVTDVVPAGRGDARGLSAFYL